METEVGLEEAVVMEAAAVVVGEVGALLAPLLLMTISQLDPPRMNPGDPVSGPAHLVVLPQDMHLGIDDRRVSAAGVIGNRVIPQAPAPRE